MQKRLTLKLCRFGKKHSPFYRIGVMPSFRSPSRGFANEFIGWYNPKTKEIFVHQDRLDYYLSINIAITETVKSILTKNKFLK